MKTWAEIDGENKVIRVVKIDDEKSNPKKWLESRLGGKWVQTYDPIDVENGTDSERHGREAGPGLYWHPKLSAFIMPQPFESWTLDEETKNWVPPVERTSETAEWDEQNQSWVEV